jgi:hypothetical protein
MEFRRSLTCEGSACVEVGFSSARGRNSGVRAEVWIATDDDSPRDSDLVYVRNSRFKGLVAIIPRSRWDDLVAEALVATREIDLAVWFPADQFPGFAATFTESERVAFNTGVANRDPRLVGTPA